MTYFTSCASMFYHGYDLIQVPWDAGAPRRGWDDELGWILTRDIDPNMAGTVDISREIESSSWH